jgi:hypothetical protein
MERNKESEVEGQGEWKEKKITEPPPSLLIPPGGKRGICGIPENIHWWLKILVV